MTMRYTEDVVKRPKRDRSRDLPDLNNANMQKLLRQDRNKERVIATVGALLFGVMVGLFAYVVA